MKCKDCKNWQGTKYSQWGDCYRVVLALNPDLECCFLSNEHGTVEQYFTVPFDPHDVKYWNFNPYWKTLYDAMSNKSIAQLGVRVQEDTVDDIIFDRENGERVGRLKLKYFQTHRGYECNDKGS